MNNERRSSFSVHHSSLSYVHLCPGCCVLMPGRFDIEVWATDARHGLCEKCLASPPPAVAARIARQTEALRLILRARAAGMDSGHPIAPYEQTVARLAGIGYGVMDDRPAARPDARRKQAGKALEEMWGNG